jgi:hypothetical protein
VWPGGFFGHRNFHAFFQSVPYEGLQASINQKLTCENI